jgi:hypothetical protein
MRKRHAPPPVILAGDADDARRLALELAGSLPLRPIDPMSLGVVLEPGETAYRTTGVWLRALAGGGWSAASWCHVVVTDARLIVRLPDATLGSLWWGSLVGFEADLEQGHVVMDCGDGWPRLLSGSGVATIAVMGVARVYGVEALTHHAALTPLRAMGLLPEHRG